MISAINKFRPIIVTVNIVIVLLFVFLQILAKEELRKSGELALFKLVPVDPRSLMQGDYMDLRYEVTELFYSGQPNRGVIVFKKDSSGVASLVRFQKNHELLQDHEYCIKYYKHKRGLSIGVQSFFFQEGSGHLYSQAKFAGIRVSKNGDKILTGLYDENHRLIVIRK